MCQRLVLAATPCLELASEGPCINSGSSNLSRAMNYEGFSAIYEKHGVNELANLYNYLIL